MGSSVSLSLLIFSHSSFAAMLLKLVVCSVYATQYDTFNLIWQQPLQSNLVLFSLFHSEGEKRIFLVMKCGEK